MSGLGGGGFAVVHHAKSGTTKVVDFGMIAARAMNPADYPIDDGRTAPDLFAWPAVVEDRNLTADNSIAEPGEIGRARCRERGYQFCKNTVAAESYKKKKQNTKRKNT